MDVGPLSNHPFQYPSPLLPIDSPAKAAWSLSSWNLEAQRMPLSWAASPAMQNYHIFCVNSALCTQSSPNTACPVQEVFPQEMPSEKVWVGAAAGQGVFCVPTECACTGAYLMHWQILDSGARKHGGNMEYLLSITTCSKVCSHEQRVWLSCKESA